MKRTAYLTILIMGIAAITWYIHYSAVFTHLFLNDAMDYASIGRNIARGDGFVSSYITPLSVANKEGLPHPNLWRAPLWPLVLGVFIRLFGATDQAVAIATGSFYIAGAGLVFLLGKELFGRLTGVISAVIFVFSAQNLLNSVSGMTETISVFMMAMTVYLVIARWAQGPWGELLAGMSLGLFYLTRYNAILFVPFFVMLLWWRKRDRAAGHGSIGAVARYLLAFGLTISPWLIRNYLLMGSPMFSLQKYEPIMFTSAYPGYSLYMMMDKVDVVAFLIRNPGEIWSKVLAGWAEFYAGLFNQAITGVSPYLYGLFLLSLILPFGYLVRRDRKNDYGYRGIRLFLVSCFLIQLAALLVVHFIYRLFFIFVPFYIIFGVAALVWLLKAAAGALPVREKSFVGLFAVLFTGLLIGANLSSWNPIKKESMPIAVLRDSVKAVTDMSSRKELIISNDGHLLAWYGDRYAAKLPHRVDMVPEMEKLAPVRFIYLSSRTSWNIPEADDSWRKLYWGKPKEVHGFRLAKVFPDGSVIYRKN